MSENNIFTLTKRVDPSLPEDYKKHALEIARREFGIRMYDILREHKTPIVVEISEEISSVPGGANWLRVRGIEDEIRISLRLTNIRYRDVFAPSSASYSGLLAFSGEYVRLPKFVINARRLIRKAITKIKSK